MSKKINIICLIIILINILFINTAKASIKADGIENFPRSYQGYLKQLATKYPQWKFKVLYTNLDWNYVLGQESIYGKNLVPKNYSDNWKNTTPGQYNIEVDRGWVDCSRQAVEYCMDPRNFLHEARILQFEALSYEPYSNNIEGIEKILYGTEFYNTQVSYFDSAGNGIFMYEKYSDLILRAGQISRSKPISFSFTYKTRSWTFFNT